MKKSDHLRRIVSYLLFPALIVLSSCTSNWPQFRGGESNLVVSGKPILAIIPFVVVGFEATILFAVFGNVIGLLTQMRLPNDGWLKYYDPRCSGEHFGVLATCEANQEEGLEDFFKQRGAEVTIF